MEGIQRDDSRQDFVDVARAMANPRSSLTHTQPAATRSPGALLLSVHDLQPAGFMPPARGSTSPGFPMVHHEPFSQELYQVEVVETPVEVPVARVQELGRLAASDRLIPELHQLRAEARQLQSQLHSSERSYEEKINGLERRCELATQLREATSQDMGFLEHRSQASRAGTQLEIESLSNAVANAERRARKSDERVAGLLAESQEAAKLMSEVTIKMDHQININSELSRELHKNEAEVAKLQVALDASRHREAQNLGMYDAAEAAVANLQATWLPRLTEEAKAESRAAENVSETRARLRHAQQGFNWKEEHLRSELQECRMEKLALGRKCADYESQIALHANAGYQWQQRSRAAEDELIRSGISQHHLWQAAKASHEEQWQQRTQLREVEEERDKALQARVVAEQSGRELRGWVMKSLDEVNRSAHRGGDHTAHRGEKSWEGQAWVDMLESFRKDQQTRTGPGCRTRQPI